jgi:hypothetical protein
VIGALLVIAISVWWFRRLTVDSAFTAAGSQPIAANADESQKEE